MFWLPLPPYAKVRADTKPTRAPPPPACRRPDSTLNLYRHGAGWCFVCKQCWDAIVAVAYRASGRGAVRSTPTPPTHTHRTRAAVCKIVCVCVCVCVCIRVCAPSPAHAAGPLTPTRVLLCRLQMARSHGRNVRPRFASVVATGRHPVCQHRLDCGPDLSLASQAARR